MATRRKAGPKRTPKARSRAKAKPEVSVLAALRVSFFPRGVLRHGRARLAVAHIDWWLAKLRERLVGISVGDEPRSKHPYYCIYMPRPDVGQGCFQEVCYDEDGNECCRGPVQCPPMP